MRLTSRTGAAAAFLLAASLVLPAPARALSPVPLFRNVERLAVFCGRPEGTERRAALCELAESVLEELSGTDVAVGTAALSDPAALTVLVNGYEVEGPDGPVMVIDVGLLRRGHVDGRLYGPAPIVVGADALLTKSSDVADSLGTLLFETVVGPWKRASPAIGHVPAEKKG